MKRQLLTARQSTKLSIAVGCCVVAAGLLIGSCAGTRRPALSHRGECSVRLAAAVKKYNAGKYSSAKNIIDDAKKLCPGSDAMDTGQYYLAMSLLQMKFYPEAKLEFSRLVQDYSRSPYFEEAQFRIGYCALKAARSVERDQADTREAQRLLTDFLENYPSSVFVDSVQKYLKIATDKLAEKEFSSARFYQKIGEKDAAAIYYKSFIHDYPASGYAAQARLEMGRLLIELNRKAEAREVLDELVAQEKSGNIAHKARELLDRCKE